MGKYTSFFFIAQFLDANHHQDLAETVSAAGIWEGTPQYIPSLSHMSWESKVPPPKLPAPNK